MRNDIDRKKLLNEIILGYRNVIEDKYSYDNLKKRSDFPKAYTQERAIKFKDYFLNYTYPSPTEREALNDSFKSLDNYLKHPDKLLRILVDSSSIIFKYGRHLPKILSAGIKALKAFRRASKLENGLVKKAILFNIKVPYSIAEINKLIEKLPKEGLEQYIKSTQNLFEILRDQVLVEKIKKILSHLIEKMKNKPKIYTDLDIKGLMIGQEIIIEADKLFNELEIKDQVEIFDFVIKMEKEVLGIPS